MDISKEKPNCPLVRFAGFTDAWEQRKLGDFGTVSMCRRIFKDQTTQNGQVPFYKIGTFGSRPDAFISEEIFQEYKGKYPFPNVGDILISAAGTIGRTVEYSGEKAYFQDSNIVWLDHGGKIDNHFLKHFYSTINWNNLEGSTITRLYNKNLLDTRICAPEVGEQARIGAFLERLDTCIVLHQRKLDQLKELKKSLLQKMFPADGEDTPRIRFAGFTDAWEQRKLKDLSDSLEYGLNAPATEFDGKNQYLRITDIDESTHMFLKRDLSSPKTDLAVAQDYLLREGDILFARTGASVGKTYKYRENDGRVYYAGFLIRARIKSEYDSEFVFQNTLTYRYQKYISVTSRRSGQPGVNAEEYSAFEIRVPSSSEQHRIGEILSTFDRSIVLHQRKLDSLKKLKKSLLQKMFI